MTVRVAGGLPGWNLTLAGLQDIPEHDVANVGGGDAHPGEGTANGSRRKTGHRDADKHTLNAPIGVRASERTTMSCIQAEVHPASQWKRATGNYCQEATIENESGEERVYGA